MKVYEAINKVQKAMAQQGIAKDKRNTQGSGYNFRGIDDVYNALSPLMSEHGLVAIPRVGSREVVERISKSGGALFYVTLDMEFDFVSAEDGSKHTARTFGEAMDSGDKATNKAMSAAFKYAMFQTFCIPTEAQDADAETHHVQPVARKVTPEVEAMIVEWIEATNSDKDKLLLAYKVNSLSELTEDQARNALGKLKGKLAVKDDVA